MINNDVMILYARQYYDNDDVMIYTYDNDDVLIYTYDNDDVMLYTQ